MEDIFLPLFGPQYDKMDESWVFGEMFIEEVEGFRSWKKGRMGGCDLNTLIREWNEQRIDKMSEIYFSTVLKTEGARGMDQQTNALSS